MNTQQHDPIMAADKREEMEARMSLRTATNRTELITAWFLNCDHFDGEARVKMQNIYSQCLKKFGALHG